ncbi:MAG TPA: YbhB/YbcL family Raf kinase inhibitor-like protein [Gammaproteobacteria bacterium]|nr:YbhB/YbcL family Raf kinase inhibitor-like protein [Gammaproteobacteria bacterium]
MTRTALAWVACVAAAAAGGRAVAQTGRLADVTIEAHVYEPKRLPATDARVESLAVPPGFRIRRFAEGLDNPRMLAVADDGTVYVTERRPGSLVIIRDLDGDGLADVQRTVIEGFAWLHGIAIDGATIYLADVHDVYRGRLTEDGRVADLRRIVRGLPDGGQHPNRTLAVGPDRMLYVSVGSSCNECEEPNPTSATIVALGSSGGSPRIFARGLRNTIGFGLHPLSRRMWGMDQGIDWLGDDEPPEELNEIVEHRAYGWPFLYADQKRNPQREPINVTWAQWTAMSTPPKAFATAHSAPMQLVFYQGTQFPPEHDANAFVAMHGSWNRKPPSGYDVERIVFTPWGSFERFEPFVTGFLEKQPDGSFGFFGRRTGVAVARDGSLLVGDDTNNTIYRVSYNAAETAVPPPQRLATEIFADAPAALQVSSYAFGNGEAIPQKYTEYAENVSPPLAWTGVPDAAQSLVLLVEDPNAWSPLPFVHWIAANIDPTARSLPEGVPAEVGKVVAVARARREEERSNDAPPVATSRPEGPAGLDVGSNSKSLERYSGPRPPEGDSPHSYHFQLFALDARLELPEGFNRNALLRAMQGHVLARGDYVGTFAKQP